MKREIKFRFWQTAEKYIINWSEINVSSLYELLTADDSVPMQFTGLTDKNGKEVYESDITKNPIGKIGIVVFYDGKFRIKIHQSETHFSYIDLSQGFCNNKEIIGNIYENPELL